VASVGLAALVTGLGGGFPVSAHAGGVVDIAAGSLHACGTRGDRWLGEQIEGVEFATLEWVAWYDSGRPLEPLGVLPCRRIGLRSATTVRPRRRDAFSLPMA
jgi:hypothetical protein